MLNLVVVDTNVLVAGLLTKRGTSPTARILNAMLDGSLLFLLSPTLLAEYRTVLLRHRIQIRHGLDEARVEDLLAEITANALWRDPAPSGAVAPDQGDQHLWDLLDEEAESRLVTGDALLLEKPPPDHEALTPAQGAALLSSGDGPARGRA